MESTLEPDSALKDPVEPAVIEENLTPSQSSTVTESGVELELEHSVDAEAIEKNSVVIQESPQIPRLPERAETTQTSSLQLSIHVLQVEKSQLIQNDQCSKLLATTTDCFNSRPHDMMQFVADFIWRRMFNLATHNISKVFVNAQNLACTRSI